MAKNKSHQVIEKKNKIPIVDNTNNRNLEHYAAMVAKSVSFHHKCKERDKTKNDNRNFQNDSY